MSDINTFEDLDVWKRGCQLALDVCLATADSQDDSLRDPMQRAAISIPSNIAEGCKRDRTTDFIRFLRYSQGACNELRTRLCIAERVSRKLGQPSIEGTRALIGETRALSKTLQGLIHTLQRRLNGQKPPPSDPSL